MAQRLATRIRLKHGFDTQKGQRSNWCKYAENAYKYNLLLSLYQFANLIMNETIVNRYIVLCRMDEDCYLLLFKVVFVLIKHPRLEINCTMSIQNKML